MTYRILITGSRDWDNEEAMLLAMFNAVFSSGVHSSEITVVHGGARGADTMAGRRAKAMGLSVEAHPADWKYSGKAAGFIRNQKMVNLGADVCLAFLKEGATNRGTRDCMRRAREAGIEVREFWG